MADERGSDADERQRHAVLDAFDQAGGNPLYLRLAFEEARRWTSDQEPARLEVGEQEQGRHPWAVQAIIEGNTFARLAHEGNHGAVLVSHALGYLAASRYGLSEDELLDLLSRDPEVYRWFLLGSFHVPLDLRQQLHEHLAETVTHQRHEGPDVDVASDDEVAEWVRQIREGERDPRELDRFLTGVLPRGSLATPRRPLGAAVRRSAPVPDRACVRGCVLDRLLPSRAGRGRHQDVPARRDRGPRNRRGRQRSHSPWPGGRLLPPRAR